MEFKPAGEIIGRPHQVRTVRIIDGPHIPDGEYQFVDMYCTDSLCDCRKTMIQVLHDGKPVSIINYGWESPSYYKQWMGSDSEDESSEQMSGPSIDITSPDKLSPKGILRLFNALMDDRWKGMFINNYKTAKASLSKE